MNRLLSDPSRARPPGPRRRVADWWRGWRWRRLYTRRHFVTALVGVAIALVTVLYAVHLLAIHDPPLASAEPQILLSGGPVKPIPEVRSFDLHLDVGVAGCKNPVHAQLLLRLRGTQSPTLARYVSTPGSFRGQILDPTRSARAFVESVMARRDWTRMFKHHPGIERFTPLPVRPFDVSGRAAAFQIDRSWSIAGRQFRAPLDAWFPAAATRNGISFFDIPIMQIAFEANWISARSYRTCYVRLPNLSTTTSPGEKVLKPDSGVVELHTARGAVDTGASIPPPDDPRGPSWRCDLSAGPQNIESSNCGGIAVLREPNADRDLQLRLIVIGAIIALALALATEALLAFRWPLDANSP